MAAITREIDEIKNKKVTSEEATTADLTITEPNSLTDISMDTDTANLHQSTNKSISPGTIDEKLCTGGGIIKQPMQKLAPKTPTKKNKDKFVSQYINESRKEKENQVRREQEEFLALPTKEELHAIPQKLTSNQPGSTHSSPRLLTKRSSYQQEMEIEPGEFFQYPKNPVPLKSIIKRIKKRTTYETKNSYDSLSEESETEDDQHQHTRKTNKRPNGNKRKKRKLNQQNSPEQQQQQENQGQEGPQATQKKHITRADRTTKDKADYTTNKYTTTKSKQPKTLATTNNNRGQNR